MPRPPRREDILVAARRLLEERGFHGLRLEDIADAAGVSRQAIYMHYKSKTGLLLAVVDRADRDEGLLDLKEKVWASATAAAALERYAELVATLTPRVHRLGMVLYSARDDDPAADAAWRDRVGSRYRTCQRLIEWLDREGALHPRWSPTEANDLLWALTSTPFYDDLTVQRGWPNDRYATGLADLLKHTLLDPTKT
jgi:AcrR family transcriptional regulator